MKSKIFLKFSLLFLLLSLLIVIPFYFTIKKDIINNVQKDILALEDRRIDFLDTVEHIYESTNRTFYLFLFISFSSSLVFAYLITRKYEKPIKKLIEAAEKIKKGDLDVEIKGVYNEEFSQFIEMFNDMVKSLKHNTEELQKKDLYINTMMDALWVVDMNDRIMDVNPAFLKMFGYKREEVIGAPIYDFFDQRNRQIIRQELEQKRLKGEHSTYQVEIIARDGRHVPVLITGAPIMKDDKIIGKIGIIKDFTEQAKLMHEIEESKEHLEIIMNSIQDAMIIIDRDYNIMNANLEAKRKYGRNIRGKKCYEVSHNCSRPCWMEGEECPLNTVFSKGEFIRSIHEHYDLKGRKCYEEIFASPIRNRDGEITHVLELLRDVTDRVRHETELRRRNQELTLLNTLASIINRSLKADEVLSNVLDKLIETFGMDGGGFFLLDEKRKILECTFHKGISEQFVREAGRVKLGEDIPGRVALTGRPITTEDISSDERVQRTILKHSGIKGYCCIPVRGKERVLGVFCLFKFKEHYFSADEERILSSVGEMTGLALENIRLYEGIKEMFRNQQDRRQREKEFLLKLTSTLASVEDINELIMEGTELLSEFIQADAMMFWELIDSQYLSIRYSKGISPSVSNISFDTTCPEVYSIEMKRPIPVYDIGEYERFYFIDALRIEGFRSVLALPVMVGDKVLGVFTVANRVHRRYDEDELHFLRIIADIFGVAYERSYLYEKRILEKGLAEAILNTISEGVCTVSTTGRIISVNRAVERLLGESVVSLVGQHYSEVFSRFSGGECPVKSALEGKEAEGEVMILKDGEPHIIKIQSLPLIDPSGHIYGAVQVLRDITKEKEVDKMRTDLIRSVSHEFRTPLSAIVGLTEMLIDREVSGARAEQYLKTIYDEGLRLSEMVSDLLNISKIESGKERLLLSEIEFDEIIETLKGLFARAFKQKNIIFNVEIDPAIDVFIADREKILKVLTALIDNSVKYSDKGAQIDLKIRPHEGYVIIEISDTGWGIPEKDLPYIGERFFRGRHSSTTKGTGLGFSLCKEIIKLHGGKINIKSKLGKGTTVTILLPREVKDAKNNGN